MSAPLAPNRIHSLPVRVTYHLPSSSQTFSTLFSSPQQVYVHPNAAASKREGEDEAWGSIYLKTVVMGVLMASPEVHPAHPSTTDLSLYVLDPRETYLRRSRASSSPFVPHLRSGQASSPVLSSDASSPGYMNVQQPVHEVWTGKGLVSWALDEPGQGKNLITGRLARATQFTRVLREQGMSALEALMAVDAMGDHEEASWGIEISIGLKSSVGGPVGMHPQVQNVMSMDGPRPDGYRRLSSTSDDNRRTSRSQPASEPSYFQRPQHPSVPKRHEVPRRPGMPALPHHASSSSSSGHIHRVPPSRAVTGGKPAPVRQAEVKPGRPVGSGGKRKKNHPASRTQLSSIDSNAALDRPASQPLPPPKRPSPPSSDAADPFPTDLPVGLFARPDSLTREQAQRLMASPAFLSMLSQLTGAPIDVAAAAKRAREGEEKDDEPLTKRAKQTHSRKASTDSAATGPDSVTHNGFVCWNCGRTKSAVWRTKVMEDGKSVRVCNACGLYWNKMGSMRPPTLWGDVDDDPKDRPRKDKKGKGSSSAVVPSSEPDIPAVRIDKPKASSDGFKRTLSSVVEQDAKRIANLRLKAPIPRSTLQQTSKTVAMTSPPRGSASATKSLRNAGASSPGGYAVPMHPTTAGSSNLNPIEESPNTTMRRIFSANPTPSNGGATGRTTGSTSQTDMQTLDMPLSDDGDNSKSDVPVDWHTDLSAFFDVDGFSMPPAQDNQKAQNRSHGISPPTGPTAFHRALSSENHRKRDQSRQNSSTSIGTAGANTDPVTEEDDVLSQLFNRTSSVGLESSPAPFDFSQLPPSSPPTMHDLPHSALLLSSPDESPLGYSPLGKRATPEKSRLRHSVSANGGYHSAPLNEKQYANHPLAHSTAAIQGTTDQHTLDFEEFQRMLANMNNINHVQNAGTGDQKNKVESEPMSYDMLQELFGRMSEPASSGVGAIASSSAEAEGVVGGDDLFASLMHSSSFA